MKGKVEELPFEHEKAGNDIWCGYLSRNSLGNLCPMCLAALREFSVLLEADNITTNLTCVWPRHLILELIPCLIYHCFFKYKFLEIKICK